MNLDIKISKLEQERIRIIAQASDVISRAIYNNSPYSHNIITTQLNYVAEKIGTGAANRLVDEHKLTLEKIIAEIEALPSYTDEVFGRSINKYEVIDIISKYQGEAQGDFPDKFKAMQEFIKSEYSPQSGWTQEQYIAAQDTTEHWLNYDSKFHTNNQVAQLEKVRELLDKLARLGNAPHLGNSEGNILAQEALNIINTMIGEK